MSNTQKRRAEDGSSSQDPKKPKNDHTLPSADPSDEPPTQPFGHAALSGLNPENLKDAIPKLPIRVQCVDLYHCWTEYHYESITPNVARMREAWLAARPNKWEMFLYLQRIVQDPKDFRRHSTDLDAASRAVVTFFNIHKQARSAAMMPLARAAAWKTLDYLLLAHLETRRAKASSKSCTSVESYLPEVLSSEPLGQETSIEAQRLPGFENADAELFNRHQSWWDDCLEFVRGPEGLEVDPASAVPPVGKDSALAAPPAGNIPDPVSRESAAMMLGVGVVSTKHSASGGQTVLGPKPNNESEVDNKYMSEWVEALAKANHPTCELSDLVLPETVVKRLSQTVLDPYMYDIDPELVLDENQVITGSNATGLLLHGSPGCGKTSIASAVAASLGATFYRMEIGELMDNSVGQAERRLKAVFDHAVESKAPAVIFFDEIDTLCLSRQEQTPLYLQQVQNTLLQKMSDIDRENCSVLVIGATNYYGKLDLAFKRRFRAEICVPLPDDHQKKALFTMFLKAWSSSDINETNLWTLSRLPETESFSADDIKSAVTLAGTGTLQWLRDSGHMNWRKIIARSGKAALVPVLSNDPKMASDDGLLYKRLSDFTPEENRQVSLRNLPLSYDQVRDAVYQIRASKLRG